MSVNLDELLVNADWTKQTCDWPLDVLGLCDERPVSREEDEPEPEEEDGET